MIAYLAGPYSNGTPEMRLARFRAITHVAAKLILKEEIIFSPLTMTHPIDLVLAEDGETMGSEFWVTFDQTFMQACSSISILLLPGWDTSSGVQREIDYFANRKINPRFLRPEDFGVTQDIPEFKAAFE